MKKISVLIIFIAVMVLSVWNGHAATIAVNTNVDEYDTTANTICSLREAIQAINDGGNFGGCSATDYGTNDTITLPADTYTLTRVPAEDNTSQNNSVGDLDILSDLSIVGSGAATTIIQAGKQTDLSDSIDRVVHIYASTGTVITVNISDVTIRNGKKSSSKGGGIYNTRGVLVLTNAIVTNNYAGGSDGGGGICTYSGSTLTLNNTTVSNNSAVSSGGGIYIQSGNIVILNNSTINDNTTNNEGGGIYNNASTLELNNSTISGNTSNSNGGGIRVYGSLSQVTLNYSTIANNTADNDNNGSGDGGGIYRSAGTVSFRSSIIADNADAGGAIPDDCNGDFTSLDYNLIETLSGCNFTAQAHDITDSDPNLGELTDNGGPTDTHALLSGSTAIDVIPNGTNDCGTTYKIDQRGETRPSDGPDADTDAECDIGAYEYQGVITHTITASAGANGSIAPSGAVSVPDAGSQIFTMSADTGYSVSDVLVDGVSVGAVTSYEFTNVTTDHTISVSFTASFSVSITAPANGATVNAWQPINFTGNVGGTGGTPPYEYVWVFGDGTTFTETLAGTTSTPSYMYTNSTTQTYSVTLTVIDNNGAGISTNHSISLTVNAATPTEPVDETAGSPVTQTLGSLAISSPAMGDVDGNGTMEVIFPCNMDKVCVYFQGTGVTQLSGPAPVVNSAPLLTDVDPASNNGLEIFSIDSQGNLNAWQCSGPAACGPLYLANPAANPASIANASTLTSAAIGNIDPGTAEVEMVWAGYTGTTASVVMYRLNAGNAAFMAAQNVGTLNAADPRISSLAVAGQNVYVGYNDNTGQGYIKQFTGASLVPGTTYSLPAGVGIGTSGVVPDIISAPAIADFDGDNNLDVVIGASDGNVYLWGSTAGQKTFNTGSSVCTTPAVSDLNGDGKLDFVVGNKHGDVYALYYNGTSLTGVNGTWGSGINLGPNPVQSSVIADVDCDEILEVIVGRTKSGRVFVINHDGSIHQRISQNTATTSDITSTGAVGDLDRDGDFELFVADENRLYVWDVSNGNVSYTNMTPWSYEGATIRRNRSFTNVDIYPTINSGFVDWYANPWIWHPEISFTNRGTDEARNVYVRLVGHEETQAWLTLNTKSWISTGNLTPGATVVMPVGTFELLIDWSWYYTYGGPDIMFYFDVIYEDVAGNQYLIHR